MSKTRKVLATLLAALMVLGVVSIPTFAALPSDMENSRYAEAAETLGALEIMVGDAETGLFRPDDAILRSEVAKIAVTAMGLQDAAQASNYRTKFPDVVENHWANGYINVATNQGLVIGDDIGTFRPDDTITYAEAMTILVRVIGHEPSALSKGAYPSGFLVVGAENNLSKNANASANEPATRGLVAQMTFNALTAKLMEQTGFGQDPVYTVVDKTLLGNKLNTEKKTGQVMATSQTKLSGAGTLAKDEVQIGQEVYTLAKGLNATKMLGYNVVFYTRENDYGDKEVILIRPEASKNDALTISADNFEGITDQDSKKVVSYWKDKENDKRASEVDVVLDAKLIYNGKTETMDNALVNLKGKAGNVNLLDTNRDGKYDVVFVTEYQNIVVDEVMPTTGKITDKYGAQTIVLDPDDEDLTYTIEKGTQRLELSDLKEWDVLSIAASKDKSIYEIIVTNEKVEGKVTELDSDGKVKIGEELYEIAANYTQGINLEDEGAFYLDVEGKIAAVDATSRISSNYAYLINAAINSYADEYFEMRVFTKDGETMTLRGADKMRLNGQTGKTGEQVLAALKSDGQIVKQLITFEKNSDGYVSSIETAQDNTATGAINEDSFTKNLNLSGAVYKSTTGKVGNVNVNEDTIVFDIPAGSSDVEDYAVRNSSMFENDTPYDAIVFDMGEDFTAKAMIVTNASYQANAESAIVIVTSVTSKMNDQGVTVDNLYAMQNGQQIQAITNERNLLVKGENTPLQKGDIIQYKTNTRGEISTFRLLFDASKNSEQFTQTPVEDLQTVYGKVTAKFSSSMNMTVNDGATMNIAFGDAAIYYVDASKQNNAVQSATTGDIQKYDSSDPSMVFVRIYKDVVKEIVIIKL